MKNISEDMLASMYYLPHHSAAVLQQKDDCKKFANMIADFCDNSIIEGIVKTNPCNSSALKDASRNLRDEGQNFTWFPRYGCVLVEEKIANHMDRNVALNLLGLDVSHLVMHCHKQPGPQSYNINFKEYKLLHVGTIAYDKLPNFYTKFQNIFDHASSRTNDKRSAAGGKQGHQRTPAFIHACLQQAFSCNCTGNVCLCGERLPKGGFTDVGQHTGGRGADTSWPLARSVFRHILNQYTVQHAINPGTLFCLSMAWLDLWIVEYLEKKISDSELAGTPNCGKLYVELDTVHCILSSAAIKASRLSDDGYSMIAFCKRLKKAKDFLEKKSFEQAKQISGSFVFPKFEHFLERHGYQNLKVTLPLSADVSFFNNTTEERRRTTEKNIGWIPLPTISTLSDIAKWLDHPKTNTDRTSLTDLFILRTVEEFMWGLIEEGCNSHGFDDARIDQMVRIVDCYRSVSHEFQQKKESLVLMQVELKSRELLVVWAAYCLIFATVKHMHGAIMEGFGVALDYNDLRHLVLSDKRAIDAAQKVADYLLLHSTIDGIFSLKNEESSFKMAGRYSEYHLQEKWQQEKDNASMRVEKHWEEVKRKQERARKLRAEIADLEREEACKDNELDTALHNQSEYERNRRCFSKKTFEHTKCDKLVVKLERDIRTLQHRIANKEDSLKKAIKPPENVIQPLPSNKSAGMPILFFLYMPSIFQHLGRFSFTAQQLLLPKPWTSKCGGNYGEQQVNIFNHVSQTSKCQFSWTDFYNNHQRSCYYCPNNIEKGSDSDIYLRAVSDTTPKCHVGPASIDDYSSKSDGIWYPDSLKPRMAWNGGPFHWECHGGDEFNPFKVESLWISNYFTENFLEEENQCMQWAMFQPGSTNVSLFRGNLPLASQSGKPEWLTKVEYLTFGKMRAFPHMQHRNLCVALTERTLPFSHRAVHFLVRQALYHLGDIGGNKADGSYFKWKRDLYDGHLLKKEWFGILKSFADDLVESPRNYSAAQILGEIINFFSHWKKTGFRDLARHIASAFTKWAHDLETEIDKSKQSAVSILRSRQVIYYRHAIILYSNGAICVSDVEGMVMLIVKSQNLFCDGANLREVAELATRYANAISINLELMIGVVTKNPHILTSAIQQVVQNCPSNLAWKPWNSPSGDGTACFEAQGNDGCVYCINIYSGAVLVDGLPPSRLPAEILNHPLYTQTFGRHDFEVVKKNGKLETVRPVRGKFYSFSMNGSVLNINEADKNHKNKLELLDSASVSDWGRDLPIRLQKLHSHWLSREHGVIVLRGVNFIDRIVSYVLTLSTDIFLNIEARCRYLPLHCQTDDWLSLLKALSSMDTLVIHESPVLGILSKFEKREFIHVLITDSADNQALKIKYNFPRFGLTVELKGNSLICHEIAGYKLSHCQQIQGSLRGFENYLILEHEEDSDEKVLLIPCGEVVAKESCLVNVEVGDECDLELMCHKYKIHQRFNYLIAQNIAARLQLAALHIASNSQVPDLLLGMTGMERAMMLVRQCWGTRLLSDLEQKKLNNVKKLCHGIYPALALLCQDVEIGSQQIHFLYLSVHQEGHISTGCDEGSAYLLKQNNKPVSPRCRLTPSEEKRILGTLSDFESSQRIMMPNQQIKPCPVCIDEIAEVQRVLDSLVKTEADPYLPSQEFPFKTLCCESRLEREMIQELEDSWDAHINLRAKKTRICDSNTFSDLFERVTKLQKRAQEYLLNTLNHTQDDSNHWHAAGHETLRSANIVPTAVTSDLPMLACFSDRTNDFNPFLTKTARKHVQNGVLLWLQLCVLEDKLKRLKMLEMDTRDNSNALVRELETKRIWDPAAHPSWLVFEVEEMIQIRPEQYVVAKHLIDNPGHVLQLNMGLGKTRVVLPMLVLHWSFCDTTMVTRLNFLSALYMEAYDYLHNHLCASILGIKCYTMPFCRHVGLNGKHIGIMRHMVDQCKIEGGVFVVSPEHRLSLENKQKELCMSSKALHNEESKALLTCSEEMGKLINDTPWRDILDESDELLHHRYQLIYAVGSVSSLPGGPHRWQVVQALLFVLVFDPSVQKIFEKYPEIVFKERKEMYEAFPSLRLLEGDVFKKVKLQLINQLAKSLIENPPYELSWMKNHAYQKDIYEAVTNSESYTELLSNLPEGQFNDVLALRGFLAGGIFVHCLTKRHRVDYGVTSNGMKRLAVPFRAADMPSERAEFAHPDCALGLSILAYYSQGLSRDQLQDALKKLFGLGKIAQQKIYHEWYQLSSNRMLHDGSECFSTLDNINKIDIQNKLQQDNMWKYYRKNMKTINFWLDYCVFPEEMQQFPQRLTATSWHLAHNTCGKTVGFSGTNDNHRILPLQVQQYLPPNSGDAILRKLSGTNGKMLDIILEKTAKCIELSDDPGPNSLLDLAIQYSDCLSIDHVVHAIIDSGALLAGINNVNAAKYLIEKLPSSIFKGILFFDNEALAGQWMMLERSGRCLPKNQSPINERDAFTIFDEPRCRGSDLKLRFDAKAFLTLGPGMCKDKLMQAAGRLRQLDQGQSLFIVGGKDVFENIRTLAYSAESRSAKRQKREQTNGKYIEVKDIEIKNVLEWTMKNTVEATANGMSSWSDQGFFFITTLGKPQYAVEDEKLELIEMYGKKFSNRSIVKVADESMKYNLSRTGGKASISSDHQSIIERIDKQVKKYGYEFVTLHRGADEECERELELELEQEEEKEEELPLMKPLPEKCWDYSRVLSATSPSSLPITMYSLPEVIRSRLTPESIANMKWSELVYCTENFINTVMNLEGIKETRINKFLRLLDVSISFSNGMHLLVSEHEADSILQLFWDVHTNKRKCNSHFLHHSFLCKVVDTDSFEQIPLLTLPVTPPIEQNVLHKAPNQVQLHTRFWDTFDIKVCVSLRLFAGETTYSTASQKDILKKMFLVWDQNTGAYFEAASGEPEKIVEMRGLLHLLAYSDLEQISRQLENTPALPYILEK